VSYKVRDDIKGKGRGKMNRKRAMASRDVKRLFKSFKINSILMFYSKLFKLSRIYSFSTSNGSCHSKSKSSSKLLFRGQTQFSLLILSLFNDFFQSLFAILRKATISFLMSVSQPFCPSVCRMEQLVWIFKKLDV